MKHILNKTQKLLLPLLLLMAATFSSAIAQPLSGTYTVAGSSPNFSTLTSAVQALISNGISGPVIFNIRTGSYSGPTWQAVVPYIQGTSTINTITIQAESGAGTVTLSEVGSTLANYTLKIDSASNINLKNITFVNSSTTLGRVIELAKNASNISITGCTLTSGVTTSVTTLAGSNMAIIYANGASGGNSFNGNNISITGNTFNNGNIGVHLYAPSSTITSSNDIIDNNTFNNAIYTAAIYTYYTTGVKIRNNTINRIGAGTFYGIYPYYDNGVLEIRNNTISTGATAITAAVYAIYGGYNTGTFTQRQGVTGNNITVNTSGVAGGVYWQYCNYDSISNNTIATTTTTGINYPIYNTNGSVVGPTSGNYMVFTGNTVTATGTGSSTINFYTGYYCKNSRTENNTMTLKTLGSISHYLNYYSDSCYVNNNIIYDSATSSISANLCYGNSSIPSSNSTVNNNTVSLISTGSSMLLYMGYYANNHVNSGNTFYEKASSSIGNYWSYVSGNSVFLNNTLNATSTGSSITNYGSYSTASIPNKCIGNTINVTGTTLTLYHGYSTSIANFDNNIVNGTATAGTITHYTAHSTSYGNWTMRNNKINLTATSTIQGMATYNPAGSSPAYSGGIMSNNIVNCTSTAGGTISNWVYYGNNTKVYNNVITTTSSAACSTLLIYQPYAPIEVYNNTLNNNSTNTTNSNVTLYCYVYSGTTGVATVRNNIISRMSATGLAPLWVADPAYYAGDYNNIYTPSGTIVSTTTSYTPNYTTLQSWRKASGSDKNSIVYDPGYTNVAANDLRPDPAKSASWSVNNRGTNLIPGNTLDITGATRTTNTAYGVPDLGAYEFAPTATAPLAVATPANPVAGTTQVFTFGQDTVATINWATGAPVPSAIAVKQYTTPPPANFTAFNNTYMYFYDSIGVNAPGAYNYTIRNYYKEPWLGTIANEAYVHMAQNASTNPGGWIGYPSTVSAINPVWNYINTAPTPVGLSSFGYYTGIDIGNNAGLAKDVAAPLPIFCAGTYPVKIRVLNDGNNILNSVKVDWTLDGTPQSTIAYTTPIGTNNGTAGSNEAIVTLGNVTFANKPVIIKAWTSLPNGVADPFTGDDTMTYRLHSGFQGTVTIDLNSGPNTDYTKITEAMADLNIFGLCGPTVFNVRQGTYTDGNIKINAVPGSSSVNKVTLQSENGNATSVNIPFSSTNDLNNYVIMLDGASYTTIKNISIAAQGATYAAGIRFNGITRADSVVGCNIVATASTSSSNLAPIYGPNAITADSCVFLNNNLSGGYYGLYFNSGTTFTNANKYFLADGNNIGNYAIYGLYLYTGLRFKIKNNIVSGASTASYGIYTYGLYSGEGASGNQATYYEITGNKVNVPAGGYGFYTVYSSGYNNNVVSLPPVQRSTFANNSCAMGSATYSQYLLYPSFVNYWNNSFNVSGSCTYGIYVVTSPAWNMNNDFRNNVVATSTSTYGAYFSMSGSTGNTFDYNNYYEKTTGSGGFIYNNASYANLKAYKAGMLTQNMEQNSLSFDPGFVSSNDLRPDPANPNSWSLNGRAVQIPGNDKDINGNPRITLRQNGVSDIGAYEFEPTVAPPVCVASPATAAPGLTQYFTFGGDTVASVKWNNTLLFTAPLSVRQYSGRQAPGFAAVSPNRYMYFYTDIQPSNGTTFNYDQVINYKDIWLGTIQNENNMILAQKVGSFPWVCYGYGTSSGNPTTNKISASGLTSFGSNTGVDTPAVFSAILYATGSTIICTGNFVTLQANAVSGYTYKWYKDGILIPNANGPTYNASQGGDYTVEISTPLPTVMTAKSIAISVTVVAPPQAFINASGALTYCIGSNLNLNANTGTGLTYQWVQNGTDIANATNSTYKVGSAGNYTVKVSNIGCTTTSPLVTVAPGPLRISLGPDTSLCERKNKPFTLDAGSPGAKYTWSTGDTTQQISVFKGNKNYWVYVDAGPGCQAADTISLNISPLPSISGISTTKTILPNNGGYQYVFTVSGPQDVKGYLWIFNDQGKITTSPLQVPPTQTFSASMVASLVMYNDCGTDTFTVVDWATGVSQAAKADYTVELYPNPATDRIRLSIEGSNVYLKELNILNSLGEVVYRESVEGNVKSRDVNVGVLANGRYLIRANTTDGIVTKPFNIIK